MSPLFTSAAIHLTPAPPSPAPLTSQCQARLHILSEQKLRLRELSFQHRQLETDLTASRLECARAEAVMERNAAEIDRWREGQVGGRMIKGYLLS